MDCGEDLGDLIVPKQVCSISQCIIIRVDFANYRSPVLLRLPLQSFSLFDASMCS
jgi:hypothetical protein